MVVTGPSGLERVDITIGLQTADKVEILSGLSAGQVVIGQ